MNERLQDYLRSLGLSADADDNAAWEFYQGLSGTSRQIANCLNYAEADTAARTSCDLMIRALGYDPANPHNILTADSEDGQRAAVSGDGGASAIGGDGASLMDNSAERKAGIEAERERQASIREFGELAGASPEQIENHIRQGVTATAAREAYLADYRERNRASVTADGAGGGPAIHVANTDFNRDAIAAGLMMRCGINDPSQRWFEHNPTNGFMRFQKKTDDDAVGRACEEGYEMSQLSMVDIAARCMNADGIRCNANHSSVTRAWQQAQFQRSGFGTANLVGTFTQVFGAVMLSGFLEAVDTTDGWTKEGTNPNFFEIPRVRMGKQSGLKKHARNSTADSTTYDDKSENTKVDRYSGMFQIDDMDLRNDTFGALADMTPDEMGKAARRLRPDLVYALLMSNPTMRDGTALFHANHSNLKTSSPLTKANLQALLTGIETQTENGVNLNLDGQYLIVPKAIVWDAKELVGSATVVIAGDTDTIIPSKNALVDSNLRIVGDSRLDNGVTDPDTGATIAGNVADYYAAAAASQHTIEVTYLRGSSKSPEMRAFMLDRGQWGIGFDVYQDIGAKALSWEGIAKADAA